MEGYTSGTDKGGDVELKNLNNHITVHEIGSSSDADKALRTDVGDQSDMARLGKRQQLSRNFGFLSMLGFATTCMGTWEAINTVFLGALLNGGSVALVYGFIICWLGTMATAASLGELASIWPTSGSQYHWAHELAPKKAASFISWIVGWITVFAWQTNSLAAAYFSGTLIQAFIVLNNDTYVPQLWHGTLLGYALILLSAFINIYLIKFLPKLEGIVLIVHVVGFFAVIIPLLHFAPRSTPDFVFTSFSNGGGWSSNGVAFMVGGFLTNTFPLIGYDGASHMSEEIQDASRVVPRSMLLAVLLNGILGFGMIIAMLFSIGNIEKALNTDTGYPYLQIFYDAVGSKAGATAMALPMFIGGFAALLGTLASASRQTWALARDNGIPFSNFFAKVSPRLVVPARSIVLVLIINMLLLLISIGSPTAFNAFVSITVSALYLSYAAPIILIIRKRLLGEPIPPSKFQLGRWGLPINMFAVAFSAIAIIFLFFPPYAEVTAANFNWAIVMMSAALIFSVTYWFIKGRRVYVGPIRERSE